MKRRTKILALLATALISTVILTGCGSHKSQSADNTKTLRIGTEGTYSPYSYRDSKGKLTGYDVEVAKDVAKKIGYKAKFVDAPWDSMLAAFNSGKTDIIFNQATATKEREAKYNFSVPYAVSHAAIIVNKDNHKIKNLDDLSGKKAAQTLTSNYAQIAKDHGATIVSTDGFSKSADLVEHNQADATLNDDNTFYDYKNQKPNANLKIAYVSKENNNIVALLHKGDNKLTKKVDKALKELQDDGTLKKLSNKYLKRDISK